MTPDGPKPCAARLKDCPYQEHGSEEDLQKEYENDLKDIHDLKSQLLKASEDYYQDFNDSSMSDEEYDEKIEYLKGLVKKYEINDDKEMSDLLEGKVAAGTDVEAKDADKVHHDVPMLSLEKAKTREVVENYLNKMVKEGATGFKLQAKLDGQACSCVYKDGTLEQMSTRGSGDTGVDMSYLINNSEVKIKGLPNKLTGKLAGKDIEIRGELFIRNSDFKVADANRQAAGQGSFANYRNANAGITKKAKKGLGYNATLSFIMYKIVGDASEQDLVDSGVAEVSRETAKEWSQAEGKRIDWRKDIEVSLADDPNNITNDTMKIVDNFGPVRPDLDIPTDGIVIKPLNEKEMDDKMGDNGHGPLSQIAWKYKGATGFTTVEGIHWSVGKTGKLTPTLLLKPVDVGGVTISRATANNEDYLRSLNVSIGSRISVERSNDVIPYASHALSTPPDAKPIEFPTKCPICGSMIAKGDKLTYCTNAACPGKQKYALAAAVGKGVLNFDGLGGKYLEAVTESGLVNDLGDFYNITEKQLADVTVDRNVDGSPSRIGETRAKHIMQFIQASKDLPFRKTIVSLNVPDLGGQTAKTLIKRYPNIDAMMNASEEELAAIPGIGEKKAKNIHDGLQAQRPLIEKLRKAGLQFEEKPAVDNGKRLKLPEARGIQGRRFSISGSAPEGYSGRREWQEFIEAMGGISQNSPNKETDYMVGDPNATSSKIKTAKKLGIKIISTEEFIELRNTGKIARFES